MSKKLTLILVDQCSLDSQESQHTRLLNDWVETFILNLLIWARTTDQIAVSYVNQLFEDSKDGLSETHFEQIVPAGPMTIEKYYAWRAAKRLPGKTNTENALWLARDQIVAHCKKYKFKKTIVYFGQDPSGEVIDSLGREGISVEVVVPGPGYREDLVTIEEFCSRYQPKIIASAKAFSGILSVGSSKLGQVLEMAVTVFPATKQATAPTFSRVYMVNGVAKDLSMPREKLADGEPVEESGGFASGQLYGSEIITIPEQLQAIIKNGSKIRLGTGFEIIAFAALQPEARIGDSYYVLANDNDSQSVMGALCQSMYFSEVVAIARYTPRATSAVQLVFLEPFIVPDKPELFLMTQAPFAQDVRNYKFDDLETGEQPTVEMVQAMEETLAAAQADDVYDYVVPDPQIEQRMALIRSMIRGKPHLPKYVPPTGEFPEAKLGVLDLHHIEKQQRSAHEEPNFLGDDEELDLDALLG